MLERNRIHQRQSSSKKSHRRQRNHPSRPTRPPLAAGNGSRQPLFPSLLHLLFKPLLQPLAETRRDFQHSFISVKLNHITRPCQHRCTTLATAEVLIHRDAKRSVHFAVDVIRNLAPDLFAIRLLVAYHGLVPFSNGSRLNQPCSHPPASRSRNISRARSSRVFTEAAVMPSASAVS